MLKLVPLPAALALLMATTTGVVFSLMGTTLTRKLVMAMGFPMSELKNWLLSAVNSSGAVSPEMRASDVDEQLAAEYRWALERL